MNILVFSMRVGNDLYQNQVSTMNQVCSWSQASNTSLSSFTEMKEPACSLDLEPAGPMEEEQSLPQNTCLHQQLDFNTRQELITTHLIQVKV